MSLLPTAHTLFSLSVELKRDRRLLARALANVPADHIDKRERKCWHVRTALDALARYHAGGGDSAAGAEFHSTVREAELLAAEINESFRSLAAVPVEQRRIKSKEIIQRIIQFSDALERATPQCDREVTAPFREKLLGGVLSELLRLCAWRLTASGVTD
jgi:hypothetical protein